jgi:hypothetical protein
MPAPLVRVPGEWDQPEPGWNGFTLTAGDVNGDGAADLVWNGLTTNNRTYVALAKGGGSFVRVPGAWDQPEPGWTGFTVHVVDVTGDGKADLVWTFLGSARNRTYVAISKGDGTFTRVPGAWDQPESGWDGCTANLADVNGDSRADLVWSCLGTTNHTVVALANGDGTFRRSFTSDQPDTGWSGCTTTLADVDGDERADLVWNCLGATNRTDVAVSNGNGSFRRTLTAWVQPESGWTGYTQAVGDVTGDGRADLVWSSLGATNRTYVVPGKQDGTFDRGDAWDQPEKNVWAGYTLQVADVTGDGAADLVWNAVGTGNRTYVATSLFTGKFVRSAPKDEPETPWTGFTMTVADVTGDGRADLVWNDREAKNRTFVDIAKPPPVVEDPGTCADLDDSFEVGLRLRGWVARRPAGAACPSVTFGGKAIAGEDGAAWLLAREADYVKGEAKIEGGVSPDPSVEVEIKSYLVPGSTPQMLAGSEPFCVYTVYPDAFYAQQPDGGAAVPAGATGVPFELTSSPGAVLALCGAYLTCDGSDGAKCQVGGATPCPKCFVEPPGLQDVE